MLNAFPYTNGHVMVAPYAHVADLRELDADAAAEFMRLTQRSLGAVERVYGPDGFNLGVNMGDVAGAGFAGHVHQHVVPRWKGDTNFMPVVGDTLVLPEVLPDSWARLRDAFAETA
jgi:ATP adenylyltransferase